MGAIPRPASFAALAREMVADGTMDANAADRLAPFVVVLPVPTPVNLNTAPPEVLAACYSDLPLDGARALARSRAQAWFNQVGDAAARLPGTSAQGATGPIAVNSSYFEVEGRVRVGRSDLEIVALIEREQSGSTRVRSLVER